MIASFHRIILAAERAIFEFGRVKFAPAFLKNIHPRFKTHLKMHGYIPVPVDEQLLLRGYIINSDDLVVN